MGLNYGMNDIYKHGVYVNDSEGALFEYRIFHTDAYEPDHIIITDLRNGKTYGPIILGRDEGILQEAKKVLVDLAQKTSK